MTSFIVTTLETSFGFAALAMGDSVSIATVGGIIAPSSTLTGAGSNTIRVAGTLQLNGISLAGQDYVGVTATGSIYTAGFAAAVSTVAQSGGSVIDNAGSITSAHGYGVYIRGEGDQIVNSGRISGYVGVGLGAFQTQSATLNNSGEIAGTHYGVQIVGLAKTLTNTGQIHSTTAEAISLVGEFNGFASLAATYRLHNAGTISTSFDVAILSYQHVAGAQLVLQNSGTIAGMVYALFSEDEAQDTITNTGLMMGAVLTGLGDDTYDGRGGDLVGSLFLGDGQDTADLRGGTVNGFVYGGAGSDVYFLSDSATVLIEGGDLDVDIVFAACDFRLGVNIETLTLLDGGHFDGAGNAGANLITGNAGENRLTGLDGLDTLHGGLGDDRLNGGNQNDALNGDDGDDVLLGGAGLDVLRGGDGDDTVTGGADRDNLGGGTGADVFVFANLAHSAATGGAWDTVIDFARGDDLVDLSRIDAKSTNALPNDAFTFIADAAFGAVAGQLRYAVVGAYVLVQMDVNGDGLSDSTLRLNGLTAVGASDFIL